MNELVRTAKNAVHTKTIDKKNKHAIIYLKEFPTAV